MVNARRAAEYAACAGALDAGSDVPGAAALYDDAAANGLAAIVGHEWPGDEFRNGCVHSAVELIALLDERIKTSAPGVWQLRGDHDAVGFVVNLELETLKDGVRIAQAIRHGRAGSDNCLVERHLQALHYLDQHPVLKTLDDERFDRRWAAEMRSDREAQRRALDYINLLSKGEWKRRMREDYMEDYVPWDPKERLATDEPQECPVCGLDCLVVEHLDTYAGQIGAGTCVACSYTRTGFIADDLGRDMELARLTHDSLRPRQMSPPARSSIPRPNGAGSGSPKEWWVRFPGRYSRLSCESFRALPST